MGLSLIKEKKTSVRIAATLYRQAFPRRKVYAVPSNPLCTVLRGRAYLLFTKISKRLI